MATPTVSEAFVIQYVDQAIIAYQRQGSKLQGTVRRKPGVVGEKVYFQKIAAGTAQQKARHAMLPIQELIHSNVYATIEDWYAPFFADAADLEKMNIDEKDALNKNGAYAIGRQVDTMILDVATGTSTYVGDYSTGATLALILAAFDKLNAADVPDDGDRYGILSAHAWAELLGYDQFARADFVGPGRLPWTEGTQGKNWLGITWLMHSGLPLASSDNRDNYLYHKFAMGLAQCNDITASMTWEALYDAWLISNKIAAGAVLIDTLGVVEMRFDDDTAITTQMDALIAATVANT